MLSTRDSLYIQKYIQVESEGMERYSIQIVTKRELCMSIVMPDKIDFK